MAEQSSRESDGGSFVDEAIADDELIALVLACPVREGRRLVDLFGGLHRVAAAGECELRQLGRLSGPRARRLQAACALGRRAACAPLVRGSSLSHPGEVERGLRARLVSLEQEEMHALGVDAHNRLVVHARVAVGAANVVYVAPVDVFRPLLREGACGFFLVHNHPTGRTEPSAADVALTARFARAGRLVGIRLLDHLILAREGHYSFAAHDGIENATEE